jgi:hypothetical protein
MAEVRPTFEFDKRSTGKLISLMDEYQKESGKSLTKSINKVAVTWLKSAKVATPASKAWRRAEKNDKAKRGSEDAYFVETFSKEGKRIWRPAPAKRVPLARIKYKEAARKVWSSLIGRVNKNAPMAYDPISNKYSEIRFKRGALQQIVMASKLKYIEILDRKHRIKRKATMNAVRGLEYEIAVLRGEIEKKARKK